MPDKGETALSTTLNITGRNGERRSINVADGTTLMDALRREAFDVLGTCGGMCSCGSCHVYIKERLPADVAPMSEDERDMLDALADVVEVRDSSRLACQITVAPVLQGLEVIVAEQV